MFSSKNSDIAFHEVFESARGSRFSGTKLGLAITTAGCWLGETVGLLPKGTVKVQNFLVGAAESFKRAGRKELLTPGYLYVCQKPRVV